MIVNGYAPTEGAQEPFLGFIPSTYHGVSTRYGLEAVGGLGADVLFKGAHRHLRDGLLIGKTALQRVGSLPTAVKNGLPYGVEGVFTAGFTASKFSQADRGKKIGVAAGSLFGGMIPYIAGAALLGPVGGSIAEAAFGSTLEKGVSNVVDRFVDVGRSYSTPNLGGHYTDSQQAYTMRARAAQEIGSSLMNARQHLGMEAMLQHG